MGNERQRRSRSKERRSPVKDRIDHKKKEKQRDRDRGYSLHRIDWQAN